MSDTLAAARAALVDEEGDRRMRAHLRTALAECDRLAGERDAKDAEWLAVDNSNREIQMQMAAEVAIREVDEARAEGRTEGIAAGKSEERAAVVAWLRSLPYSGSNCHKVFDDEIESVLWAAKEAATKENA